MHKKKITKGFTLIELVVAVGLLGIIVGIGGDLLTTMLRAYRKAELFSLVERNGGYALSLLEQDVRSAISIELFNNGVVPEDDAGNEIRIAIPRTNGTREFKRYRVTFCDASTDGAVEIDADDSNNTADSYTNIVGSGETDLLDHSIFIRNFGVIDDNTDNNTIGDIAPFVRLTNNGIGNRNFDMVYISFVMAGGRTCDNPEVQAGFQTSVNLRGGLQ